MPSFFDNIRDFFSDMFGKDDNEDEDFSWGGVGDDSTSWGGDLNADYSELDALGDFADRILDNPGGGEFVQTFFDANSLMEYLEGTPESVLQFEISEDGEEFYVYRFDS